MISIPGEPDELAGVQTSADVGVAKSDLLDERQTDGVIGVLSPLGADTLFLEIKWSERLGVVHLVKPAKPVSWGVEDSGVDLGRLLAKLLSVF